MGHVLRHARRLSTSVLAACVVPRGVEVTLSCAPLPLLLPTAWLWASAPSHHDPVTNQRRLTAISAARAPSLVAARAVAGGAALEVQWGGISRTLAYPAAWLAGQRLDAAALQHAAVAATPRPLRPLSCVGTAQPSSFDARAVLARDARGEAAVWALLAAINRDGIAIVRGCDTAHPAAVLELAGRIAPPQPTIYGLSWAVEVADMPINVAFSNAALELHQDLAYMESPPGLQLLLCRQFGEDVVGGESTFADGFAAAELLRERDPSAFATLARVPTTFQKVHYARERPVHMVYARPCFALSAAWHNPTLTGVFWAPPFEGPLRVPEADVAPYFAAYASFASLLDDIERCVSPGLLEFRLTPGDAVVFNNRRMLHGRRAFSAATPSAATPSAATPRNSRVLQGCYVNADDWVSRLHTLGEAVGGGSSAVPQPLSRSGNQNPLA